MAIAVCGSSDVWCQGTSWCFWFALWEKNRRNEVIEGRIWNQRKVKRNTCFHLWLQKAATATQLVRLPWTAEYSIKVEQISLPRRVFCSTRPSRWMNLGLNVVGRTAGYDAKMSAKRQKWLAEVLCWRFNHGHVPCLAQDVERSESTDSLHELSPKINGFTYHCLPEVAQAAYRTDDLIRLATKT